MIVTLIIAVGLSSCKKKKRTVAPAAATPFARTDNVPPNPAPRDPTTACSEIPPLAYVQGATINTILHRTIENEEEVIKAFPNWYSFELQKEDTIPYVIVDDACIMKIFEDNRPYDSIEVYPNLAEITLDAAFDDYGSAWLSGSILSGTSKTVTLKTGLIYPPFTVAKNIIALKSINSTGFGGVAAHVHTDDCGELDTAGQCDGTGYEFYSEKPLRVNYSLPPGQNCSLLYTVNFNAISSWGLSLDQPSGWTTTTNMDAFTHVPEGYPQNTEFWDDPLSKSKTFSGYPLADWLSTGIRHPYCGPEGEDYGSQSGDPRPANLYYKTILTCNYYYCWQDTEDLVQETLFIP